MVRVRKIVRKQQLSGCTPACTQNFQKNLKPNAGAAYSGFFDRAPGHQNSAPNCSQLGVFICVSRMTRGVPAHSACARGWSDTVPMAASSTLFCPLFSRNLCQLFRRSTRTSPCTTTSCACVDFSSSTTRLDKQTIRQTPSSGTRTASSTNPRVYGTPRALRRHGAGPRIAASLCRGASP